MGFTHRLIASEADFENFAKKYHLLVVATAFLLQFVSLGDECETFEISKVSFRWLMGVLAAMMASTYFVAYLVRAYSKAIGSPERIYEEMAMFFGFLTLLFYSVYLFGF